MTEPTDSELNAVIAEYLTRIYPQDMHPRFERAIMRAAIAKWGQPQAVAGGEPVACGNCGGTGRMVRDPDIGTDQECFVCDGTGSYLEDTAPPPQAVREPVKPDFYTACAWYEGGGEADWIALPGYSNETEHGVKHLVLEAARKEGYKGTVTGRLMELGWEIRPVYLAAPPPQAVREPTPAEDAMLRGAALRSSKLVAKGVLPPQEPLGEEFERVLDVHRFDLYAEADQPAPVREPLTPAQITAAAKKLAECIDYPWEHMPEQGRAEMRKHAQAVLAAAHGGTSPPPAP